MTQPNRPPTEPRLLALDIDGTILDAGGRLLWVVRDAVHRVAAAGVQVVLVTGRSPWHGVAGIADALGLPGIHLTMQGALALDPGSHRVERARHLDRNTYLDALEFAAELGIEPVVTTPHGHRAMRLPTGIDFIPPGRDPGSFRRVGDLRGLVDEHPMRVYLPTGHGRHHIVRLMLAERFLGRAAVVWGDLDGVELIAHGVNKGEAIEWLAERRGIPLADVAAVGDAWNDTEMLRVAGRSAAMGSAPAEVQAAADIVVPTSDEAGVVDAMAWFYPDLLQVRDTRSVRSASGLPA